jgi:hypothetical protein
MPVRVATHAGVVDDRIAGDPAPVSVAVAFAAAAGRAVAIVVVIAANAPHVRSRARVVNVMVSYCVMPGTGGVTGVSSPCAV